RSGTVASEGAPASPEQAAHFQQEDIMRNLVRLLGCTLVALVTLGVGRASAAQQTTLTVFSGVTSGSGTWTRTITDISEPGSPGRASVLVTTNVNVAWTPGMTAA